MSSEHKETLHAVAGEEHQEEGMTRKKILVVFGILSLITAIEFLIALVLVPKGTIPVSLANPLYILLTLAKAFYIIAYFMHLKFEKVALIYSIVVPVLFIVGLILVLTNESHYWIELRKIFQ